MGLLTYMVLNLSTSTQCGTSPHTCNPTHLPLKCESLLHGSLPLERKSVNGWGGFMLKEKIKGLKQRFKEWNKTYFGDSRN